MEVFTRSWKADGESLCWTSDGRGGYTIEEAPGESRGSRIVLHLKEEHAGFADKWKAEAQRLSNFVPIPLLLNGERVNKVEALWLKNRNEISEDEYNEFYKFDSG